jgi:hypothetical protein
MVLPDIGNDICDEDRRQGGPETADFHARRIGEHAGE